MQQYAVLKCRRESFAFSLHVRRAFLFSPCSARRRYRRVYWRYTSSGLLDQLTRSTPSHNQSCVASSAELGPWVGWKHATTCLAHWLSLLFPDVRTIAVFEVFVGLRAIPDGIPQPVVPFPYMLVLLCTYYYYIAVFFFHRDAFSLLCDHGLDFTGQ